VGRGQEERARELREEESVRELRVRLDYIIRSTLELPVRERQAGGEGEEEIEREEERARELREEERARELRERLDYIICSTLDLPVTSRTLTGGMRRGRRRMRRMRSRRRRGGGGGVGVIPGACCKFAKCG
jgi:hypothetical protein